MYHNKISIQPGLLNLKLGDKTGQGFNPNATVEQYPSPANELRDGHSIHAIGLRLRFALECEQLRPNCVFKVQVIKHKSDPANIPTRAQLYCGAYMYGGGDVPFHLDDINTGSLWEPRLLKEFTVQHQPNYSSEAFRLKEEQATLWNESNDFLGWVENLVGFLEAPIEGAAVAAFNAAKEAVQNTASSLSGTLSSTDPSSSADQSMTNTTVREVYVPLKGAKIQYPREGQQHSDHPIKDNICVVVSAFDSSKDAGWGDIIGIYQMSAKLIFKDT